MSSKTVGQNMMSGLIAGAVAMVIYVAIAAGFNHGLAWWIVRIGLMYGAGTFVAAFLISRVVSVLKAKQ
ncbi:MAG: hypothetical protein ABIU20_03740 [Blastocatellia bacterium]